MGQALYRKYRSRALSEVVGQEHITQTLQRAIESGRISHAYLFTGPRGTGKTSVARILAHAINQLPYSDTTHLDIIEIDAASNRRIDDIRELREKIHIAPSMARYKIYIIDEVHMLTGESFNALLKTLEEPPSHVIFILATTEVHKLPATIISRTQRYNFRPMDTQKGAAHLKQIADQEHIPIDNDALSLIAAHGAGSFRDSISLLDQLANIHEGQITAEAIEQHLGLAPRAALQALITAITKKQYADVIEQLDKLETHGATTAALVPQLLRALQPLATKQPELFSLLDELLTVPRAYNPTIKLLVVLTTYALQHSSASNKPVVAQVAKPVIEIQRSPADLKKQHTKSGKPSAETAKKPLSDPVYQQSHVESCTPEQWQQVVQQVKKSSPPLSSILSHIEPQFDADTQLLTLATRFKLHLTKLEDAKAKQFLAQATQAILGGVPQTKIILDPAAKAAPKPAQAPAAAALDETSQSVVDIMGGGEPVHD